MTDKELIEKGKLYQKTIASVEQLQKDIVKAVIEYSKREAVNLCMLEGLFANQLHSIQHSIIDYSEARKEGKSPKPADYIG